MMGGWLRGRPRAVDVSATALCAALYAIGCLLTAYITSPWGFGQFRPAVVIPGVFAIIFGPWPAAIGAAIGTLVADSIKHGTLYIPSLVAAVPGNFIGFFMLGRLLKGRFSWRRFVVVSSLMLVVANAIVAFLYVGTIYFMGFLPPELSPQALALFALALTIWWFATMLPFMLFVTPILVKAIARAAPSLVPEDVVSASFRAEDRKMFFLALVLPGLTFVALGALLAFTPLGSIVFAGLVVKLKPGYALLSLEAMKFLLAISGSILFALGLIFGAWSHFFLRATSMR